MSKKPFEVGQSVICVNDQNFAQWLAGDLPERGMRYTVESLHWGKVGGWHVILKSMAVLDTRTGRQVAINCSRFAPTKKRNPSIEVFRKMLERTPA